MPKTSAVKPGNVYGKLTVDREGGRYHGSKMWWCDCLCGGRKEVIGYVLLCGGCVSCGCYRSEVHSANPSNLRHGEGRPGRQSTTWHRWHQMVARVRNNPKYAGVTICDRWLEFANFKADMGECPSKEHGIDRIENAKGYHPENCRWATMHDQARNRSTNVWCVDDDGSRIIAKDYAKKHGIGYDGLLRHLRLGRPAAEARTRMMGR